MAKAMIQQANRVVQEMLCQAWEAPVVVSLVMIWKLQPVAIIFCRQERICRVAETRDTIRGSDHVVMVE